MRAVERMEEHSDSEDMHERGRREDRGSLLHAFFFRFVLALVCFSFPIPPFSFFTQAFCRLLPPPQFFSFIPHNLIQRQSFKEPK